MRRGAGWKGGRARGREEQGDAGGFYSGKFSVATSDFILKYWLKRRTAYLRAEKQADGLAKLELKVCTSLNYHKQEWEKGIPAPLNFDTIAIILSLN